MSPHLPAGLSHDAVGRHCLIWNAYATPPADRTERRLARVGRVRGQVLLSQVVMTSGVP